jgi:hypothetical protein
MLDLGTGGRHLGWRRQRQNAHKSDNNPDLGPVHGKILSTHRHSDQLILQQRISHSEGFQGANFARLRN